MECQYRIVFLDHSVSQDFTGLTTGPWPQRLGWHAKGIVSTALSSSLENLKIARQGALAACIMTALLGIASVCWYAAGESLDDEELEADVQAEIAQKQSKSARLRGLFNRVN